MIHPLHIPLLEFDENQRAIINPKEVTDPVPDFPKTVVSCFARSTFKTLLDTYPHQQIAQTSIAHSDIPIYKIHKEEQTLAIFNSQVGSPACVGILEDLYAMGMEKLVLFGTCGVLDSTIEDVSIVIPNRAVRDEGTSFHYLAPSYEVAVNQASLELLTQFLQKGSISYRVGKAWTTDAIFRETVARYQQRKAQGCLVVDMECSAVAAWAHHRQVDVCHFFYAADHLSEEVWDSRSLSDHEALDSKAIIAKIAVDFAAFWQSKTQ